MFDWARVDEITFRAYRKSCRKAVFGRSAEGTRQDTLCYLLLP